MIDTLNIIAMVLTIALGLVGFLAPGFTMKKLGLKPDGSNMGYTEIRAANGALFVGAGLGALFLSLPAAFAMVGFLYAGAAAGRITGILFNNAGSEKSWGYFSAEALLAIYLLIANL
ncbi:DUF4345 family protein [Salinimonas chungwhensis]|uniref:DUF4345 family protein n=1 Tax=Salinimonas chungwhensis TaxID=265425 RepID=UPI00036D770B|nr:DUF4345 family protein [Salinimonas chungwhensis]